MRSAKTITPASAICALIGLCLHSLHAQPVIVEPGWTLTQQAFLPGTITARGAHFHPLDGMLYYADNWRVVRVSPRGDREILFQALRPDFIGIHPETGDIFACAGGSGAFYRIPFGTTTHEPWFTGYHSGEPDPAGMTPVPAYYTGPLPVGGRFAFTDNGYNGGTYDGVYWFDPDVPATFGTIVQNPFNQSGNPFVSAIDVTFTQNACIVADNVENTGAGQLFSIAPGAAFPIATDRPIAIPIGVTYDQRTDTLLVAGIDVLGNAPKVMRVDLSTVPATVTDVIVNFPATSNIGAAGIDLSEDGSQLAVTQSRDNLFLFSRDLPPGYLPGAAYRCESDSPFDLSGLGTSFWLEDFEDGQLNTPGVTASVGNVYTGGLADSVDCDDGVADGNGSAGATWDVIDGAAGVRFAFHPLSLGGYPTRVAIAWTDGAEWNRVEFEAFDARGVSLGQYAREPLGDGAFDGATYEDRLFGVEHATGVSAIEIRSISFGAPGGLEVDHLQYGDIVAPRIRRADSNPQLAP